jgi:hypothetical protein
VEADWSPSALISLAATLAAVLLLATWVNRRIDLSRVDLGVGPATLATRFLIRSVLVVAVWLAAVYLVGIVRIALLRF